MSREKGFIEYPLCLSYEMAVAWMKAGHQLWQEITDDFPSCTSFESLSELEENFPDKEIDETDNIHLVTKTPETPDTRRVSYKNCLKTTLSTAQEIATRKHLEKYAISISGDKNG